MSSLATATEVIWRLKEAGVEPQIIGHQIAGSPAVQYCHPDLSRIVPGGDGTVDLGLMQRYQNYVKPPTAPPKPAPSLSIKKTKEPPYPFLGDERVMLVGAGAGSIMLASYLIHRGADPENITIADPSGGFGGLWDKLWVQEGGFNNPVALYFSWEHRLALKQREGARMGKFIGDIAHDFLPEVNFIPQAVIDIKKHQTNQTWLSTSAQGFTTESEHVVLATGKIIPHKIDSKRIRSNLDDVAAHSPEQIIVERNQRQLTHDELSSGRPIILMGLGNSVSYMLRQIQAHEIDQGTKVSYWVLTDRKNIEVENPELAFFGNNPIFRDPKSGYLTGYSADIATDKTNYYRAWSQGKIIPEVTKANFDARTGNLVIAHGRDHKIKLSAPHVFALLGYDSDKSLLRSVGALDRGLLRREKSEADIRPCDGAVYTRRDGYASNVFTIGALAATRRNPNAAVLPGIFAQAPATALTIALRCLARQSSHA